MKIKSILVMCVITFLIFFIYLANVDKKIYFVSINDYTNKSINLYDKYVSDYLNKKDKLELFVSEFSQSDMRITDVIKNIEDNVEIIKNNKKITLKQALIKSDLLILYLGSTELKYKINTTNNLNIDELYNYIDETILDFDKLLELIRKYCKEDIILLGIYYSDESLDEVITYYNKKLSDLTSKYNISFIDLNNEFKNQVGMYNKNEVFPNKEGHIYISQLIKSKINTNILDN